MWSEVIVPFQSQMGTGLIVIWYLLALVYLFLKEKRKEIRVLFLYAPIVLLLLYFNPLFAKFLYTVLDSEIYYRILWLLPVTVVIAYACVSIYGSLKGIKKNVFALGMAGLLMISGSFIYSNPLFHEAENKYHMPNSVVEICDAINVPGREVLAVFPMELLHYVRQYSPTTCMPYGREVQVTRWEGRLGSYVELYEAMEEQKDVVLEQLAPLTRDAGCHYVVLRKDKKIIGETADWDWELFFETEEYAVYRDLFIPLEIPHLER